MVRHPPDCSDLVDLQNVPFDNVDDGLVVRTLVDEVGDLATDGHLGGT